MTAAATAKKPRAKKSLESVALGGEPVLKENCTQAELIRALNWFNYNTEPDMARKWLSAYGKAINMQKEKLANLQALYRKVPSTLVSLSRLYTNGSWLSDQNKSRLHAGIDEFLTLRFEDEDDTAAPAAVIPRKRTPRLDESALTYLWNLYEDAIKSKVDIQGVYEHLVKLGVDEKQSKMLKQEFTQTLEDLRDKNDPQIKEGYKFLSYLQWKRAQKFLESLMDELRKFSVVKKAAPRKPRTKKAPSVSKVVAKVKFQKADTSLGLQSISPDKVVGASIAYTFNTKTRVLAKYVGDKLSFKGTSLVNFDEEKSKAKKIRKPALLIDGVCSGTPKKVEKYFDGLSTTETAANGRFNEFTIIVRVF